MPRLHTAETKSQHIVDTTERNIVSFFTMDGEVIINPKIHPHRCIIHISVNSQQHILARQPDMFAGHLVGQFVVITLDVTVVDIGTHQVIVLCIDVAFEAIKIGQRLIVCSNTNGNGTITVASLVTVFANRDGKSYR